MICRLIVIAKEPIAGRVKTRLCPPFSVNEAAALAEASFRDTIEAARGAGVPTTVALDGRRPPWLSLPTIPQRGSGLAERLANAFLDAGGPALLIGMDTPQITSEDLAMAVTELACSCTDAILGPASDGGYWAIGLKRPDPAIFRSVPMSTPDTGMRQRKRLRSLGLRVVELHELRDVDTYADAEAVAALAPQTRFAHVFDGLSTRIAS